MPTKVELETEFWKSWLNKGAQPAHIRMALRQAENWTESQLGWIAPNDPELQARVRPNVFKRAIEKLSENWLKSVTSPEDA